MNNVVKPDALQCINRTTISLVMLTVVLLTGCYAPLRSPGIPAATLSDEFRMPIRTAGEPLNFSSLSAAPPQVYLLGNGDIIEITIPDLIHQGEARPFQVQLLETGEVLLPHVGPVMIGGLSLVQAQQRINHALGQGYLQKPGASISLVKKGVINVVVLGAVERPGVYELPRYENDIAHALAAAGGLSEDSGEVIEVHRQYEHQWPGLPDQMRNQQPLQFQSHPVPAQQMPVPQHQFQNMSSASSAPVQQSSYQRSASENTFRSNPSSLMPSINPPNSSYRRQSATPPQRFKPTGTYRSGVGQQSPSEKPVIRGQSPEQWNSMSAPFVESDGIMMATPPANTIVRIPLKGCASPVSPQDIILNPGDVVVVPKKTDQVFFVVGPLSESNRLRFTVNDRDREIGNGLLLPRDREVDVVTAVAMAGYIDPINSPVTVTVHRTQPDGMPLLIKVNLIKARYNPQETVLVQPGDIIYLNPDASWYSRRLFDRLIDNTVGRVFGN